MTVIKLAQIEEKVVTRDEFPLKKATSLLRNETIAIIGYGIQGSAQALNLKDNGFNVIVGQRQPSATWDKAVCDGWIPNQSLFSIQEACEKGTFICYLLSDAAQMQLWPIVKKLLTSSKTLCFSHGF